MALFKVTGSIIVRGVASGVEYTRSVPPFIVEADDSDNASRIGMSVFKTGIGDNYISARAEAEPYSPSN